MVDQPSVEDTISILRGLKERYEAHHGVRIKDAALVAAATLSESLHLGSVPPRQGDRPGRRGRRETARPRSIRCRRSSTRYRGASMQLEIEREALRKENDARAAGGSEKLEKELAELRDDRRGCACSGSGEERVR